MEANSAFARLEWWWSSVKVGWEVIQRDVASGEQVRWAGSSVCRTSHRIWVAFLALKSSGVSSSTVSPLPFTPSSRSLLYSLYRKNDKRHCREGAHRAGQARPRHTEHTVQWQSVETCSVGTKSPKHRRLWQIHTTGVKLPRVVTEASVTLAMSPDRKPGESHVFINNMETWWHETDFLPSINDIDTLKLMEVHAVMQTVLPN